MLFDTRSCLTVFYAWNVNLKNTKSIYKQRLISSNLKESIIIGRSTYVGSFRCWSVMYLACQVIGTNSAAILYKWALLPHRIIKQWKHFNSTFQPRTCFVAASPPFGANTLGRRLERFRSPRSSIRQAASHHLVPMSRSTHSRNPALTFHPDTNLWLFHLILLWNSYISLSANVKLLFSL